jgi:hypothetical protein
MAKPKRRKAMKKLLKSLKKGLTKRIRCAKINRLSEKAANPGP